MVKYLIGRPVAVLTIFSGLIILGLCAVRNLPVSLLPNVDIPQIIIKVNYPNMPARALEEEMVKPIRESLSHLSQLKDIESQTSDHSALLFLTFEYGSRMDLAYIEVNEKIDRLNSTFPLNSTRPQVIRVNTSDVPVLRIQAIPKDASQNMEVSALIENTVKKRLEQIDGVSLVDINGLKKKVITIKPQKATLLALGIEEKEIAQAIKNANTDIHELRIIKGQFSYLIKVGNNINDENVIRNLPVRLKNGTQILLKQIADIQQEEESQTGYHLLNGKGGFVIAVEKQAASRMNELVPKIKEAVNHFRIDYPQVAFQITQDQSFLLDAGISNLYQDLVYGGILTVALLFIFLGNWASPLLMSINIPLSLVITFVFFYLFNISLNIISLSGLALGIGMLIDNSIVVIDNITRKRKSGMGMLESTVEGTNEVIVPVISQVLTTVAVYLPLILLSGIGGTLISDQSIALSISLFVSLLVAFVLTPLLYKLLLKTSPENLKQDTIVYNWIRVKYHSMIEHILHHRKFYFFFTLILMPFGLILAAKIPVSNLPKIEKKESLVKIDWDEPIDAGQNLQQVKTVLSRIQNECLVTEVEVGIKQFSMVQEDNEIQKSEIYYSCKDENTKLHVDSIVRRTINSISRRAIMKVIDAPNAFTQLFSSSEAYVECRFKAYKGGMREDGGAGLRQLLKNIPDQRYASGQGMVEEPGVDAYIDYKKLAAYGVERQAIEDALEQQFGIYNIAEINRFGDIVKIVFKTGNNAINDKLDFPVRNSKGALYPLRLFVAFNNNIQPKIITSDKTGEYRSIVFNEGTMNISGLLEKVKALGTKYGYTVNFTGKYFENQKQVGELWQILLLVVSLLYFILVIQYESLLMPIVVMLTAPLGIFGGMLLLWLTGGTLDVMAAIGFIVILGLVVDDPILKVETLMRLEKEYQAKGVIEDDRVLGRLIHEAGDICLKPLLMVSLTTSIALVPVLFVGGIGNDLQKPLSIVIIGGLTIGTFFTTWFIPLAYWYIHKWKRRHMNLKWL